MVEPSFEANTSVVLLMSVSAVVKWHRIQKIRHLVSTNVLVPTQKKLARTKRQWK